MDLTDVERCGIIDTGLDWLTVTAVSGSQTDAMLATARKYVSEKFPPDALPKKWAAMGYIGQDYGTLKFGRRKAEESILIASGQEADYIGMNFEVPNDRVKRVDLQVTVSLDTPVQDLAFALYRSLTRGDNQTHGSITYKYISSNTGDTLYSGKRSGDTFLRLYDKSLDQNVSELGSLWRYEVEYKRDRAQSAYKAVKSAEARYATIARMVWDEFERRGMQPMYDPGIGMVAMETITKVTTPDTKLAWLERCVAPVITQLVALGYEQQVIDSLKLRGVVKG